METMAAKKINKYLRQSQRTKRRLHTERNKSREIEVASRPNLSGFYILHMISVSGVFFTNKACFSSPEGRALPRELQSESYRMYELYVSSDILRNAAFSVEVCLVMSQMIYGFDLFSLLYLQLSEFLFASLLWDSLYFSPFMDFMDLNNSLNARIQGNFILDNNNS